MKKNMDAKENNPHNLDIENCDDELSPLKRNIIRIISASLFIILIFGTVCLTDSITEFFITLFK